MPISKIFRGLIIFIISTLLACSQSDDSHVLNSYPQVGICAIGTPPANSEFSKTQKINMIGWAFDLRNHSVPASLTVYLIHTDSKKVYAFSAKRGHLRPDVVKAFNNTVPADVGFSAVLDTAMLNSGSYKVMLVQVNDQAEAIRCKHERLLINVK